MRKTAFLLVGIILVSGCGKKPSGPNVVLLVMDTTRGDRCSVGGYVRETTPRLASFAEGATVYRNAWSPTAWTMPAHASLFTGLRPEHHGLMRGNREFLFSDTDTLAERFQRAGYQTGCFTNNETLSPSSGLLQGFDRVDALYLSEDRPYPWAVETHRLALDWALKAHRAGERFFLFINNMEPHFPYTPPPDREVEFRRPGTARALVEWGPTLSMKDVVEHNFDRRKLSRVRLDRISDLYDAEIRALDEAIGSLIDGLRAADVLENTVFVVAGDHGENLGDHGLMDHVFSLHRSICHVPLIIRSPLMSAAGRFVDDVVRLEDVPATLLELCGIPIPEDLDGRSLLRDLGGRLSRGALGPPIKYLEQLRAIHPDPLNIEPFKAKLRSVFDGRYHLIRYSDGREELYDVNVDPLETKNLATNGGEVLRRLRGLLQGE